MHISIHIGDDETSYPILLSGFELNSETVKTAIQTEGNGLEGFMKIVSPVHEDLILEDNLIPLVLHICFRTLAELFEKGESSMRYFSWTGELLLSRKGDKITISGDGIEKSTFDFNQWTKSLWEFGKKFTGFCEGMGLQIGYEESFSPYAQKLQIQMNPNENEK